jgi:hypothetical protein
VDYEEIPIVGCIGEIRLIDFSKMEKDAEHMISSVHRIALREMLSRSLMSMWDWEVRTQRMFEHNALQKVQDVVVLSLGQVNRLQRCGYVARKEVYSIFTLYHIKLNNWSPEHHRSKAHYKFKE